MCTTENPADAYTRAYAHTRNTYKADTHVQANTLSTHTYTHTHISAEEVQVLMFIQKNERRSTFPIATTNE